MQIFTNAFVKILIHIPSILFLFFTFCKNMHGSTKLLKSVILHDRKCSAVNWVSSPNLVILKETVTILITCAGLGLELTRGTTAWCSLLISQNNNCLMHEDFPRTCQQYPDPFICMVHVFIKTWQFLRAINVIQSISYHSFIIHNPAVFKGVNQNWPNLLWKFALIISM